jgi:hypothetical protein
VSADPILVEYYAQRAGEFERVYQKPAPRPTEKQYVRIILSHGPDLGGIHPPARRLETPVA